jgi:integrase
VGLSGWLAVRGSEPGPILCPVRKGGRILIGRMSGQALYARARLRAKQAGLRSFCLHDGRRTLLSTLWAQGKGKDAQKIAGHASIAVTAQYDRRDEREARKALEGMEIPF